MKNFPAFVLVASLVFVTSIAVSYRYFSWLNAPTPVAQTLVDTLQNTAQPVASSVPQSGLSGVLLPTSVPLPLPPVAKTLTNGTQVFQTFNNCGPASLSMALSYYVIKETQGTLGKALRPYQNPQGDNDDKSVTLIELAEKAKEYGFVVYRRPMGDIELLKQFIANDMPIITRTWLHPGEDIGHFRVIKGYDEAAKVLIQDDSLQGKNIRYSYNEFLDLWKAFQYEFLVLVPAEKQAVAEQILGERVDEQKAWTQALVLSDQQIQQSSSDMYARFNRSVALYYLQRYQESIQEYERVESQLPFRMLWYQLEPLLAYRNVGNDARVLSLTQQILDRANRAYSELYFLRGEIFQKQGRPELAAAEFAKADQYNNTPYWKSNLK